MLHLPQQCLAHIACQMLTKQHTQSNKIQATQLATNHIPDATIRRCKRVLVFARLFAGVASFFFFATSGVDNSTLCGPLSPNSKSRPPISFVGNSMQCTYALTLLEDTPQHDMCKTVPDLAIINLSSLVGVSTRPLRSGGSSSASAVHFLFLSLVHR